MNIIAFQNEPDVAVVLEIDNVRETAGSKISLVVKLVALGAGEGKNIDQPPFVINDYRDYYERYFAITNLEAD